QKQKKLIMLPSEIMIWQPEFTDKILSRKPGAVHACTSVLRSLAILLLLIISTLQGRLVSPQNREEHLR
ncbi:hypothetical protein, partial [Escherichia coli]|uniref:hypothetical protein n=1 Tax=Escherichia coli TaxID=562 RepID=UPI00242B7486